MGEPKAAARGGFGRDGMARWGRRVLTVACALVLGSLAACGSQPVESTTEASSEAVGENRPTVYDRAADGSVVESSGEPASDGESETAPEATPTAEPATVSLSAVGENLMHEHVVYAADAAEGSMGDGLYDFGSLYEGVREIVASHDINFIDIETPMGGDEQGLRGYPSFNTPSDNAADIASFGFNLAATATNHAWDSGFAGVQAMMGYWAEHPEVIVAGTYTSEEDRNTIRTFEENGITFAFLSYSDYLNGNVLPADQSWAIADSNDQDAMKRDLERASELADFTIVAMSWGVEYSSEVTDWQRSTTQFLVDNGADLVLGFGPHVIQPVEWVEAKGADGQPTGRKGMVAYSLGNFVSYQQKDVTQVEGCFTCDIVRDDQGEITIQNPTWIPLVNHFSGGTHRVYQYKDYSNDLGRAHSILGAKADPLGYVRDYTLQIVDPEVVHIDFGDGS